MDLKEAHGERDQTPMDHGSSNRYTLDPNAQVQADFIKLTNRIKRQRIEALEQIAPQSQFSSFLSTVQNPLLTLPSPDPPHTKFHVPSVLSSYGFCSWLYKEQEDHNMVFEQQQEQPLWITKGLKA